MNNEKNQKLICAFQAKVTNTNNHLNLRKSLKYNQNRHQSAKVFFVNKTFNQDNICPSCQLSQIKRLVKLSVLDHKPAVKRKREEHSINPHWPKALVSLSIKDSPRPDGVLNKSATKKLIRMNGLGSLQHKVSMLYKKTLFGLRIFLIKWTEKYQA